MEQYTQNDNGTVARGSHVTDKQLALGDLEKTLDKIQGLLTEIEGSSNKTSGVANLNGWVERLGQCWNTYQEVSREDPAVEMKNIALAKQILSLANQETGQDHTLEEVLRDDSFLAAVDMAASVYKRINNTFYGVWALDKLKGDNLADLHSFHQQFQSLVGLEEGSPVLALHNQISRWYRFGDTVSAGDFRKVSAVLDRAFEAHVLGEKLTRIKPSRRAA